MRDAPTCHIIAIKPWYRHGLTNLSVHTFVRDGNRSRMYALPDVL